MSLYEDLNQAELADLLKAYDSYISEAANSRAFLSGWTPVGVKEFYENEYPSVWQQGQSFSQFFSDAKKISARDVSAAAIAAAIDNYYWEYDTYNYKDEIDDREQAVADIETSILNGKIDELKDILTQEMDTSEFPSAKVGLQMLIGQLNQYQEQLEAVQAKETAPLPQIFGDVMNELWEKPNGHLLDIWVVHEDGLKWEQKNLRDMILHPEQNVELNEWLKSLPVKNIDHGKKDTVLAIDLVSEFTSDQTTFLLDADFNHSFNDPEWGCLCSRAAMAGASFADRLAFLKEGKPFEKPFDGRCMDAVDKDDRKDLCNALAGSADVYVGESYYFAPDQRPVLCPCAYMFSSRAPGHIQFDDICRIKQTAPGKGLSSTMDGRLAMARHEALKAEKANQAQERNPVQPERK